MPKRRTTTNSETEIAKEVDVLISKALELLQENSQVALNHAEKANLISTKNNYEKGVIWSEWIEGFAAYFNADYIQALRIANNTEKSFRTIQDTKGICYALRLQGMTLCNSGKYQDAIAILRKCISIARKNKDNKSFADALMHLAIAQENLGNREEAIKAYFNCFIIYEGLNDKRGYARVANNIAAVFFNTGDYPKTLEYLFESLNASEDLHLKHNQAAALANIGTIYGVMNEHSTALAYELEALSIYESLGDKRNISVCMNNVGNRYRSLNNIATAIRYHRKSLSISQSFGYQKEHAQALWNLGIDLKMMSDFESAQLHLNKALEIATDIENKFLKLEILIGLANLNVERESIPEAIKLLEEAKSISLELDSKQLHLRIHEAWVGVYEKLKNENKKIYHQNEAQRLHEQIFGEKEKKKTKELIRKFELNKAKQDAERYGIPTAELNTYQSAINLSVDQKFKLNPEIEHKRIKLRTFGKFELIVEGRVLTKVDWQRKKVRDVFKYLMIHYQQAVAVEELAEQIWQSNLDEITTALKTTLSHLRKALEPLLQAYQPSKYIVSQDQAYALDFGDEADIDFINFKRLCQEGIEASGPLKEKKLLQAIALYQGDFLREDLFEDWVAYERESLKELYITSMLQLATIYRDTYKYTDSISICKRILEADKVFEPAYDLLFQIFKETNQQKEIKKTYAFCSAAFQQELEISLPERYNSYLL